MPPIQPKNKIQSACIKGVQNAFKNYFKWSGGQSLGNAPEGYIQTEIARELSKVCPFVTLEDSVRSVLRDASASLNGPNPRNKSGRIDITTWWANETPRVLIEVKKAWRYDSITSDSMRLKKLLNRGGSHREGIIVVFTTASKAKTIDDLWKTLASTSDSVLSCNLGSTEYPDIEGGARYWDVACFQV